MLTASQLAALEWSPLKHPGRVDNFAIGKPSRDARGQMRYMMGCGHKSLPGKTVCERGCLQSPNWNIGPVRHPEWDPLIRRAWRKDKSLIKLFKPPAWSGW
ncbi:MAG TPA: hypothetical protein VJN63_08280 [Thermoplasmata archaeon]|nr:hypothetical protein [Thermoplasmata archaeon]